MNENKIWIKFKTHFKNVNYYSMPTSILFVFRKRVNFIYNALFWLVFFFWTII